MIRSIAIMQPYFLPYIGYWQLMNVVEKFVVYDNIKYTKKGWINRNRYLHNGKPKTMTLPLKADSDHLTIAERYLSDDFEMQAKKLLRQIEAAYKSAPYFKDGMALMETCLHHTDKCLFNFLLNSLSSVKAYLNIDTQLVISSDIRIDHQSRSINKVKAICQKLDSNHYINPQGGTQLYDRADFEKEGLKLSFLYSTLPPYKQLSEKHIPSLSIIDIIMYCDRQTISRMLSEFHLL